MRLAWTTSPLPDVTTHIKVAREILQKKQSVHVNTQGMGCEKT
jgi:hypothetical protein